MSSVCHITEPPSQDPKPRAVALLSIQKMMCQVVAKVSVSQKSSAPSHQAEPTADAIVAASAEVGKCGNRNSSWMLMEEYALEVLQWEAQEASRVGPSAPKAKMIQTARVTTHMVVNSKQGRPQEPTNYASKGAAWKRVQGMPPNGTTASETTSHQRCACNYTCRRGMERWRGPIRPVQGTL